MSKRARRVDVLAEEQRAVDHAYRCLARTRQEAATLKSVGASASGKDAIDANHAWQRELESLDLGRNSLVFMRADVDEGSGRETFYIGRRAVFDAKHNPAVISWSSPAAVQWRLTSEQEPGDVRLLRQIVCDERVVKRYFDLHGMGEAGLGSRDPEAGRDAEIAAQSSEDAHDEGSPAVVTEEQDWHDPLLDELDRARDGAMHDIVETIQREQLRLVTEQPEGVLIVQGGPGTGKTAVGMHRVSWLLDNDHMGADDILVVGPNRGFLGYVRTALVELGSQGVTMLELPALWSGVAAARDPYVIATIKSDARMSRVLRRAVDNHTTSTVERLEALVGGTDFTFELHRREVVVPVVEIADIAGAALAGDSPYRVRHERCAQRVVQHLAEAYIALLPGPADADYFGEIRQLRSVGRLLRRIAPELSAHNVLRRLLSDGVALAAAAEGVLTPTEQSVLVEHHDSVNRSRSRQELSLEDLVCMDELEHLLSGRPDRTYGHVVIDEAQDITPMQARSLARRCPSGSMTILGDLAQATGPFPYEDWEELGSTLTGRHGWRVAELLTGFRVPGEVMEYARPLGAHCAPGIAMPDSVRRTGERVTVSDGADTAGRAARRARELAEHNDVLAPGITAVIVPSAPAWKETIVSLTGDESSVLVLTAEEAKGLEFDYVVVVEPSAIAEDGDVGLRRLYVALTRCTQSLTVIHHRPLPHWIGGPVNPVPTPKQFMAQVNRRKTPGGGPGLCTRYRANGNKCDNETRQADGWCRQPGCGGFRTAQPLPLGRSGYLRQPKSAVVETRLELSPEGITDVRISSVACGAFVARHRGSLGEAAVELHAMLSPFLVQGRHLRFEDGWFLESEGYRLVLDADTRVVTGYSSGHPERSYAQVVAGVPSRVGQDARAERRSALTPPSVAEPGTDVADETAVRNLEPGTLHVTVGACAGYEKVAQARGVSDGEFVRLLREELLRDLGKGRIEWAGPRIVVDGARCQWSLRTDGRVLTTVRSSESANYRRPAPQDTDVLTAERTVMPTTSARGEVSTADAQTADESELAELVAAHERTARADHAHESLRHRLLADLYEHSADVGSTDHVDAWSAGPEGIALFEVVGGTAHTYVQVREAALHLMEAACLHPLGQAEYLVVVLREPPVQPWLADAADQAFSVGLAWRNGAGWAGPAARHITGVPLDEGAAR